MNFELIKTKVDLMFHASSNKELIRIIEDKKRKIKAITDRRVLEHWRKPLIRRILFKAKEIAYDNRLKNITICQ